MPDSPLKVILLIGLPGAGKSTFSKERFPQHVQVSKDNFPSARRPAKRQAREIRSALEEGSNLVVDNTNASPEERAAVIEIAAAHQATIIGYWFEFTPAESIERNLSRPERDRVKPVGIYDTAKRLRPPSYEEGFHQLYKVRAEAGEFQVRAWDDESERI